MFGPVEFPAPVASFFETLMMVDFSALSDPVIVITACGVLAIKAGITGIFRIREIF